MIDRLKLKQEGLYDTAIYILKGRNLYSTPITYSMFDQYRNKLRTENNVRLQASLMGINETLVCLAYDLCPEKDKLILDFMESIDHNELWTNMSFMNEFRKRLKFYKMYPDE